jgi:hypothetical protein
MELGPLARLLIWLLKRCPSIGSIKLHTTHSSRPVISSLDPDLLSADLKDPRLRSYYIEHLEACLTMPSRFKR